MSDDSEPQPLSDAERDATIVSHSEWSQKLANAFARRKGLRIDNRQEVRNVALLALVKAAHDFDQTIGVQFHTYAEHRINGAMLDFLREQDYMPRTARKLYKQVVTGLNGAATPNSFQQAIDGLPVEENTKTLLKGAARHDCEGLPALVSKDTPGPSKKNGLTLAVDFPAAGKSPEALALEESTARLLRNTLARLTPRERAVLEAYFFEEKSLKEAAEGVGVSENRANQIKSKALDRLRKVMEAPIGPTR